jgi:hypothetical protein
MKKTRLLLYFFIFFNHYDANQNPSTFSINAKKGDDIMSLMGEIFTSQNKKFIFKGSNLKLSSDIICNNFSLEEIVDYFSKNFNIIIKKNKQRYEITSSGPYWQKYNLNIINNNYLIKNKNQGDEKSINNPFYLHHTMESNNNIWQDIECNIKNLTEKYIINKNYGFIALYTNKENHIIFQQLLQSIKKQNDFFFIITIKFWLITSSNNNHHNPIIIDNNFLEQIQNIIEKKKPYFILNENHQLSIDCVYEHKLSTMNNIPVIFNNQMETLSRHKDSHEYIIGNRRRDLKTTLVTEKFFEGVNLYIHPVFNDNNILVYFLPNIINRLGKNVFYNKSLSSIFIMKPQKEFVLGGFTRDYKESNKKQIPWFKKIPLIKNFFSNNSSTNKQEKLVISIHININYQNNI